MRFNLFLIPLILIFIASCSETKPNAPQAETLAPIALNTFSDTTGLDSLKGIFIGDFGGSDIRMVFNHVSAKHVVGYNLHKGLRRNIAGKLERHGDTLNLVLSEPGDNEFDGIFTIEFLLKSKTGKCSWMSNSGRISPKEFTIEKLNDLAYDYDISHLNNANFAQAFYWVEDSLGAINFDNDGQCIYSYYPKTDDVNRIEQKVEIKGSWSFKTQVLTINWQKNTVFPTRKSLFRINKPEEYEMSLIGEGREFQAIMF